MLALTAIAAGLAAVAGITAFLIAPGAPSGRRGPSAAQDEPPTEEDP